MKTNSSGLQQVIYKGGSSAIGEAFTLSSIGFGVKINSNCVPGVGWQGVNFSQGLAASSWIHLTAIYNGSTLTLYKNGIFDNSFSITGLIDSCTSGSLRFGNNNNFSRNYFNGLIDDIGIWNRALTQNEITDLYNASLTITGNVGINNKDPKRNLHINDVLRLEPRDAPPSNPGMGDIYFDKALHKLRVYDGTTWQNCW